MKKTQEIIGLPIISISDGMEVGKVKSIIINADKGAIDYVVVDSGIQILSAKVIPTDSILGIGEYALTIENESSINEISKIPAAIDLLQKNIQVKGTKVLTKKGRLIGEIGDIFVDENDACRISGLEYIADITQKKIRIIPRESVITFGKNLLVVKDDVEGSLLDRSGQLESGDKYTEVEKKNLVNSGFRTQATDYTFLQDNEAVDYSIVKADEVIASKGSDIYKEAGAEPAVEAVTEINDKIEVFTNDLNAQNENIDEAGMVEKVSGEEASINGGGFPGGNEADAVSEQDNSDAAPQSSAAGLFEQRQRQYLIGRRVTKTITDNYGSVIADEGAAITNEVIDAAKGKGKLIELIMNNRA